MNMAVERNNGRNVAVEIDIETNIDNMDSILWKLKRKQEGEFSKGSN